MPFDQFTIEQLAGDLLPERDARRRQIATGFHRNTMLNEEGGIDPLEFRFYAMVDRVATTGTTWLGLTVGCAQCHTHKYDPIPHREYYQFMAFLNNADEPELDRAAARTSRDSGRRSRRRSPALIAELPDRFPPEADTGERICSESIAEWHEREGRAVRCAGPSLRPVDGEGQPAAADGPATTTPSSPAAIRPRATPTS